MSLLLNRPNPPPAYSTPPSHKVKAPTTRKAKACMELESHRRWICTGEGLFFTEEGVCSA
jgi:hypothetical protein